MLPVEIPAVCCYATSIKTRIETQEPHYECEPLPSVVMLLPLKQGLKRGDDCGNSAGEDCCYATSIKTRIETSRPHTTCQPPCLVVMLLPLKQGLKRWDSVVKQTA